MVYRPGHNEKHQLEYFVGVNPANDDIAKLLVMVALEPVVRGREIDHGHSVTYPEGLVAGNRYAQPPRHASDDEGRSSNGHARRTTCGVLAGHSGIRFGG